MELLKAFYEMLQEDSNGETGFEFVDKKIDELSVSGETAGEKQTRP